MMPSQVSVSRNIQGGSRGSDRSDDEGGSDSPGIRVTNEVNISREQERASRIGNPGL